MAKVQRDEIFDYVTYGEQRDEIRSHVLEVKNVRRILVGEHFAFLFENHDTIRYQVHEMMRTERIVKEADIQHELDTYNELLGGPGEVGCTLLIGLEDEATRNEKLTAWLGLPKHLYAKLEDGTKVRPTFDPRQVGDTRLSSVQYLKFEVGPKPPVALGSDMDGLAIEAQLSDAERSALAQDLADA